jgi:hypothetical protein
LLYSLSTNYILFAKHILRQYIFRKYSFVIFLIILQYRPIISPEVSPFRKAETSFVAQNSEKFTYVVGANQRLKTLLAFPGSVTFQKGDTPGNDLQVWQLNPFFYEKEAKYSFNFCDLFQPTCPPVVQQTNK